MMHLTEARVGTARVLKFGLRDSYRWHQAAWESFPDRPAAGRDFLTRLDQSDDGFRLLILSQTEPVCPRWCDAQNWRTMTIPESLFASRVYRFQLCANPSRKVTKLGPDGSPTKNGRRVPLTGRDELEQWIGRKGEQGGFVVNAGALRIVPWGRGYFYVPGRGESGLHSAVDFQGVLEVIDAAQFRETFRNGIGSAKGFGFGLLALQPLR